MRERNKDMMGEVEYNKGGKETGREEREEKGSAREKSTKREGDRTDRENENGGGGKNGRDEEHKKEDTKEEEVKGTMNKWKIEECKGERKK